MKIDTPEISWHAKEAIYSVDIQPKREGQPHRLATAGIDSNVRIWELRPGSHPGVIFLSNLARHERAVNVVRFSKYGETLASGGDDGTIVLWKLNDRTDVPNIFDDESEVGSNVESWSAVKILRGHLEDVNDLCWSEDGGYLVSGSIDHTAIIWDISKGSKLSILSEAKHFIHGVTYDPKGEFIATMSGDRSMRIYSTKTKRVLHNTSKMLYPKICEESAMQTDDDITKPQRMFHDESVVRRRLSFTTDASLLIVPAGCLNKRRGDQTEQINTAYVFSRNCFTKPAAVLPGFKQPVTVVRSCPAKFHLRKNSEGVSESVVDLPYRLVFAVASSDTVVLYDSQTLEPLSIISNVHYASITDIAWSYDARQLVISSRDGFCTIINFEEDELGEIYSDTPRASSSNETETPPNAQNKKEIKTSSSQEIKNSIQHKRSVDTGENVLNCTTNCSKTGNMEENVNIINLESEQQKNSSDAVEAMDTSTSDIVQTPTMSSSQEKKPRRVQLTTISHSPKENKPRRVQLHTVAKATPEGEKPEVTPTKDGKVTENGTPPKAPDKSARATEKKASRRIQLTTVTK